jgi:hypothetical protein
MIWTVNGRSCKNVLLGEKKAIVLGVTVDLGDIAWGGMNWIGLAQDKDQRRAPVNAVMKHRVP